MDKEKQPQTEHQAASGKKHEGKKHEPQEQGGEALPSQQKQPEQGCEEKLSELNDKYLRLTAEFDNYKKRTAKEKEALAAQSEARLVFRLLPIYEEIGLAEKEVGKLPESEARKGTLVVLGKLRQAFEAEGLQPMKLDGEKLDPFRHEVALREDSGEPEGTIVRVIKNGYLFKGGVLQHAMVSVSSGKKAEAEKQEEKKDAKEAKQGAKEGNGKDNEVGA